MSTREEFAHLSEKLGLSLGEAAFRCGIGVATFEWLVDHDKMPKPRKIRNRRVWDRRAVDEAFARIMSGETVGGETEDAEDEYAL